MLILLFFLDFLPTACRRAADDTFSLRDAFPACDGNGCVVAVAGSQPRSGFLRMAESASVVGFRRVVVTGIRILCDVCLVALLSVAALFRGIRTRWERSVIHSFRAQRAYFC